MARAWRPDAVLPRVFSAAELPAGVTEVRVFCPGCLVVGGPSAAAEPDAAARIATHAAFADWPLVVLSDEPRRAVASAMNFLWTTFTRFEPGADIHAAGTRIVRNHVAYSAPIVIDARHQARFPRELSCRPDIAERVTSRWREYFPTRRRNGGLRARASGLIGGAEAPPHR